MTEKEAAPRKKRNKRVPMGTRNRLKYASRKGFHRRVFNDVDDRIQQAKEAGYEIVQGKDLGGEPYAGDASQLGSTVRKPVGGGKNGVLMEIPNKYYVEDQEAKQARIDAAEQEMRESRDTRARLGEGQYGGVDITRGSPPS